MNKTTVKYHLTLVLDQINKMLAELTLQAEQMNVSVLSMRSINGDLLAAPLMVARANILVALLNATD